MLKLKKSYPKLDFFQFKNQSIQVPLVLQIKLHFKFIIGNLKLSDLKMRTQCLT